MGKQQGASERDVPPAVVGYVEEHGSRLKGVLDAFAAAGASLSAAARVELFPDLVDEDRPAVLIVPPSYPHDAPPILPAGGALLVAVVNGAEALGQLSDGVEILEVSQEPASLHLRVRALLRAAAREHRLFSLRGALKESKALHKSVTDQLRRAEGFTEELVQSSLDMIIATDVDQRVVVFNRAAEKEFGYAAHEILGKEVRILYSDAEEARRVHTTVRAEGLYQGEVENRRKDGTVFTSLLSATPMYDDMGDLSGYMGVSRDQSVLHSVRDALRVSEERYKELVHNANSIILRLDEKGTVLFFNEFAESFFGWRKDEIVGRNVIGTIVPRTETTGRDLRGMVADILMRPDHYVNNENENIRKDGSRVWVSWTNRTVTRSPHAPSEILCIGNDITRLKDAEHALSRKAQELSIANAALVDSNELLRVADQMKSTFLASMSHELRTPLNAIIGFTGILLMGMPGALNEEQRKQLQIVEDSANHLLSLINEVLDISKVEAGRIDLYPASFQVREMVGNTFEAVRVHAEKKGLHLVNEVPADLKVETDPGRVKQILLNLLSNAVKFTDTGMITVSSHEHQDLVSLCVHDTGIGIAPDDLEQLFLPFQQIHSTVARNASGTGLGLYLCRKLSGLLGGSIEAHSTPGEGSSFTVSFLRELRKETPVAQTASH